MAKKSAGKYWALLILIVVGALLYHSISERNRDTAADNQRYTLEKTGAGVVADYSAAADRIHVAVDSGLSGAKLAPESVEQIAREVPRQDVEGVIRWSARKVLVVADTKLETVEQAVQDALGGSGGEILTAEADSYQGTSVVRIDVGLKDSLEGGPVTLITDRIYLKKKESKPAAAEKSEPAKLAGTGTGTGTGRMAIIIDDFGYNAAPIPLFAAISRPLTFSVLPYHLYSTEAASQALSSGHQVMLHLPMEPLSSDKLEPTTIKVSMTNEEIQQTVVKAIAAVPGIVGVNNHEGSKATADERVMHTVLTILRDNNLFFVDSRTNSRSIAYSLSREMGLATGENELFIDNSSDVADIKARLHTAAGMALRDGSVTVIGHARTSTATALRETIPELEAMGVTLVFESQLVH